MQVHRLIDNVSEFSTDEDLDNIISAEKFELPPIYDGDISDEVIETCTLLRENKLFRLPYHNCYVESFTDSTRHGIVFQEKDDGIICFHFFEKIVKGQKPWTNAIFRYAGEWVMIIDEGANARPVRQDVAKVISDASTSVLLNWLVFLWVAKGTTKIKYSPPEKLNKTKLERGLTPIDSYTKVLLPGAISRGEHKERGEVESRKRPKLHWVSGHIRDQKHGVGRTLVKKIFIAPFMKGYEEEGRVYHLQYGQELTPEIIEKQNV